MIRRTLLSWQKKNIRSRQLLEQETEAIDEKTVRRTNGNGGPCAMLGPLRETRWTHERVAKVLGVGRRTPYRYASGDVQIPEPSSTLAAAPRATAAHYL